MNLCLLDSGDLAATTYGDALLCEACSSKRLGFFGMAAQDCVGASNDAQLQSTVVSFVVGKNRLSKRTGHLDTRGSTAHDGDCIVPGLT